MACTGIPRPLYAPLVCRVGKRCTTNYYFNASPLRRIIITGIRYRGRSRLLFRPLVPAGKTLKNIQLTAHGAQGIDEPVEQLVLVVRHVHDVRVQDVYVQVYLRKERASCYNGASRTSSTEWDKRTVYDLPVCARSCPTRAKTTIETPWSRCTSSWSSRRCASTGSWSSSPAPGRPENGHEVQSTAILLLHIVRGTTQRYAYGDAQESPTGCNWRVRNGTTTQHGWATRGRHTHPVSPVRGGVTCKC